MTERLQFVRIWLKFWGSDAHTPYKVLKLRVHSLEI